MTRPFWVYFVGGLSLFFVATGVLYSAYSVLSIFNGAEKIEEAKNSIRALPLDDNEKERSLAMIETQYQRSQTPLYRCATFIMAFSKILITVGLMIGVRQLFRLQLRGIKTLTLSYLGDMIISIFSFVIFSQLFADPATMSPDMSETGVLSTILIATLAVYLIPNVVVLLCLWLGDKSRFEMASGS